MIPTLRVLTRKTKLRFGKWKDYTVQELLDLRRQKSLISPYYKLTSINYTEDILNELKITKDYRIEKPGSDREMYFKFISENNYHTKQLSMRNKPTGGADIMKIQSRPLSKAQLKAINQGNR
mgnify:CR=1 FL=1|jgi:hypothetical protein